MLKNSNMFKIVDAMYAAYLGSFSGLSKLAN
jgi:hypothetical protein